MRELEVLLNDRRMGRIATGRGGRPEFEYDEDWRRLDDAVPMSVCMPLVASRHGPDVVEPFLWGILPDNERILAAWGRRFQVSPRSTLGLLGAVGRDCPGALEFVSPGSEEPTGDSAVLWLDEAEVAARIGELRSDPSAGRRPGDPGRFSLAGAQAKTALLLRDGRWGVPSGKIPTTHILKPPMPDLEGVVELEHHCLELARECGLPAATSEVRRFGEEVALVVRRFDRVEIDVVAEQAEDEARTADEEAAAGGDPEGLRRKADVARRRARELRALGERIPLLRVHQEDLCQALAVRPEQKYQAEGGPGTAAILGVLRDHSIEPSRDVETFVAAVGFNWLIAGTDAHAKNFALLHERQGRIRLAPLYDVISGLPFFHRRDLKTSMAIAGEYRVGWIARRHWERLAKEARLDADAVVARLRHMAESLPERAAALRDRAREQAIHHPVLDRFVEALGPHAAACAATLEAGSSE